MKTIRLSLAVVALATMLGAAHADGDPRWPDERIQLAGDGRGYDAARDRSEVRDARHDRREERRDRRAERRERVEQDDDGDRFGVGYERRRELFEQRRREQ